MKTENNVPQKFGDFSEKSLKKAIRDSWLNHWLTRYPLALAIGFTVCAAIIADLALIYCVCIGGATLAIGIINALGRKTFCKDKIVQQYYHLKRVELEKQSEQQVGELQRKLQGFGCQRAVIQTQDLKRAFHRFKEKLEERIGSDKPEYNQYLGAAQTMHLGALQSLNKVVDNERDKEMINVEDSARRIKELEAEQNEAGRDNSEEIRCQEKQIDLVRSMDQNSKDLIKEVEGAITALIEITQSLPDANLSRAEIDQNMQSAIDRFYQVAESNKRIYDKVAEAWNQMRQGNIKMDPNIKGGTRWS